MVTGLFFLSILSMFNRKTFQIDRYRQSFNCLTVSLSEPHATSLLLSTALASASYYLVQIQINLSD